MSEADAKLVDRIEKLLRLATNNPNEEEARSAALSAAKLIVAHQFVIGRPATPTPATPPSAPYDHAAAAYWQGMQQYWREMQQREQDETLREAVRRQREQASRTPDGGSWWQKR
jgi:hypothetical protein